LGITSIVRSDMDIYLVSKDTPRTVATRSSTGHASGFNKHEKSPSLQGRRGFVVPP
jgi:hypothetical protein